MHVVFLIIVTGSIHNGQARLVYIVLIIYKSGIRKIAMEHNSVLFAAQLTPKEWYRIIRDLSQKNEMEDENVADLLEFLIDTNKIDINVPLEKETWLVTMVKFERITCIQTLLNKGANVQLGHPESGVTPIISAVMLSGTAFTGSAKRNIIKLIAENDHTVLKTRFSGKNLMYFCYAKREFESMSLLLELGFDINMTNYDQNSVDFGSRQRIWLHQYSTLFFAVSQHVDDVVDFLIERGANPNTCAYVRIDYKDTDSMSLLNYAMFFHPRKLQIMEKLLRAGAQVDKRDGFGRTCLWHAAARGDKTSCDLLLQYGANPNASCSMQYGNLSPLDKAPQHLKRHILKVVQDRQLATHMALMPQDLPPELVDTYILPPY